MCFRDSKDFLPMEFNYTSTHLQTSVHWELCIPPSFWSLNAMQVPNCALRTVVTGRELDPVMSVTAQTISVWRTVWVTFVNNETTMLSREMQRNAEKYREKQRNAAKFREMQICKDILVTFMTDSFKTEIDSFIVCLIWKTVSKILLVTDNIGTTKQRHPHVWPRRRLSQRCAGRPFSHFFLGHIKMYNNLKYLAPGRDQYGVSCHTQVLHQGTLRSFLRYWRRRKNLFNEIVARGLN